MNCFCLGGGLKSKPHLFPGALNSPASCTIIKAIINLRTVFLDSLFLPQCCWFSLFYLCSIDSKGGRELSQLICSIFKWFIAFLSLDLLPKTVVHTCSLASFTSALSTITLHLRLCRQSDGKPRRIHCPRHHHHQSPQGALTFQCITSCIFPAVRFPLPASSSWATMDLWSDSQ